jgi:hypothetical protein
MYKISAFDFFFNLTFQRSDADRLEDIVLRNFLIHGHEGLDSDDPWFGGVMLIINLFVWILNALSLTYSVGKFNIDLTNFGRGAGTTVSILLIKFHMVIGRKVFIDVIIVQRNLCESPGRPIKIRINGNRGINGVDSRNLSGAFLEVVITIPQTTFQVVDKIRLDMIRVTTVKMVVFDAGGGFIFELKGLNVENGLFVGLE